MLICTDFSESAQHAAQYGCILARQYGLRHITLLHAYQTYIPALAMPVTPYEATITTTLEDDAIAQLKKTEQQLIQVAGPDISISTRAEDISLDESINKIIREENSDIVIMGISGRSGLEKIFIGSDTLNIFQHSHIPVLAVPAKILIEPVKSVLVACDLKNINETIPVNVLIEVLELFKVPVTVLNVDHHEQRSPDTPLEIFRLHEVFDKYKPRYAFTTNKDIPAGILDYAESNLISLIIVIPKNYNFFGKLFHKSTTKELFYHSSIPVLSLPALG